MLLLLLLGGGFWLWGRRGERGTNRATPDSAPIHAAVSLPKPPDQSDEKPPPAVQTEPPSPKEEPPRKQQPPVIKPPEDKPPEIKPAPPPPAVEVKKEIALAEDLDPELEFQIVDAINAQREKAGLEPVFLDLQTSRTCQARARALAHEPSRLSEKDGPAALVAQRDPLAAIARWMADPVGRELILQPRLELVGAGFARNVEGRWVSVFDWSSGVEPEGPSAPAPDTAGAAIYPGHDQKRVPLWFPGNETPDPLPDAAAADKVAGYPITVVFPRPSRVEDVRSHLETSDEKDIAVWLSTPDQPANPKHRDLQQNTVCLIARQPLRPRTRYTVRVTARVDNKGWSANWSFTTLSAGEIRQEMTGRVLRTINEHRRKAGLKAVALDEDGSRACAAHALYLAKNAPTHREQNWNEEKRDLPGYTEAGGGIARGAFIQGGGGPIEAVTGLINSMISRGQVLDPQLRALGLGYTPFARGGWIWVMSPRHVQGLAAKGHREILYPAADQKDVPLAYPMDEVPSPVPPEGRGTEAGYAITACFPFGTPVTEVTAQLVDGEGRKVDGWLSTPEKPAIAGYPQSSIAFLPRTSLKPDTRYTATFTARVRGAAWQRTWRFTTLQNPDRFAGDLDAKLVVRLNVIRKAAGLNPVEIDAELSRACQAHARYLARNATNPAASGLAVHREDPSLPGYTPEGAKAANHSVIAFLLDPRSAIDGWMATLYHRLPLLAPDLRRVGVAHTRLRGRKWACVLDTGSGRAPR